MKNESVSAIPDNFQTNNREKVRFNRKQVIALTRSCFFLLSFSLEKVIDR